jgi:RHS repeat-associated protein
LTEVKFKNNAGTVTKVVSYTYDVFDRLIGNAVDTDGDTDIDHQEAYVYDGNQIVLRFAANTSSGLAANDLKDRYLWGPAVDQLLADEQVTSLASAGTVYWALGDHENSVRDWARYSGGTTTIADHAEYDSFGNRLDSPTMDSVFGWTGRYHDTDTGLQWNGSSAGGGRWYDPKVGRWISEDRIEFGGDLSNIARYGGNSPTNGTDPSGLQATIPGAAANAAAAGWTAKEIATTFGLSLAAAEALVNAQKIADAAEQVIKTITENVRRMKFGDPCTAAKEAVKQAKKGLDSLEKVIKEHEGKIQNPRGNITRWQPGLTEQQYIDVLIKKWQADIERAKFNIEASKKALEVLEAAVTATCGK